MVQHLAISLLAVLSAAATTVDREVLPKFATGPRIEQSHGIARDSDQRLNGPGVSRPDVKRGRASSRP
jgi:hypothetical protein